MSRNQIFPRLVAGTAIAVLAVGAHACGDDSGRTQEGTTTTSLAPNGTEIDRSAVPPGAAPGDGSGQGKTPEGNTNSGDSATTTRGGPG
jgi:hypothetical protein